MRTVALATVDRGVVHGLEGLARAGRVRVRRRRRGDLTWWLCTGDQERLCRQVAEAVVESVLVDWERAQVVRAVGGVPGQLGRDGAQAVAATALARLSGEESTGALRWRRQAARRLEELLEQEGTVVLEGFLTFRLRDYRRELEILVDRLADDLLLEREHREFVALLRRFLRERQSSPELHLVAEGEGRFRLVDRDGRRLDGLPDGHREQEDVLIAALLSLAPRLLVVHGRERRRPGGFKTLREIFEDRVSECPGCELCRSEETGRAEP